jgi:hypothetical protein
MAKSNEVERYLLDIIGIAEDAKAALVDILAEQYDAGYKSGYDDGYEQATKEV